MKHNQLYNELTKAGCFITRHGAEHDEWFNPKNGMKIRIPRHGSHEVKTGLLRRIKKRCSDNKSGQPPLTLQMIAFCNGCVENSFYMDFKQIRYMAKNVVLILEYGDGGYSCYNDEPLGNYGVIDGDGATAEEAKADFMKALQECRDDNPDNKDLQDLTFTFKYDVQAFFKEFSFLNATEIARRAGINPSLMRQYVSGVKTAGEKTYQRLNACMRNIKADLQAAVF